MDGLVLPDGVDTARRQLVCHLICAVRMSMSCILWARGLLSIPRLILTNKLKSKVTRGRRGSWIWWFELDAVRPGCFCVAAGSLRRHTLTHRHRGRPRLSIALHHAGRGAQSVCWLALDFLSSYPES